MRSKYALLLASLAVWTIGAAIASADTRPNIVLFVTDDQRADVLGCAGHQIVLTPHIDELAAAGVRYSNAFVTTSICAASRASILTGLVERTHRTSFGTGPLALAHCEDSYPARLRVAGYHTGFVGKFDLAVEERQETLRMMFDSFVAISRTPNPTLLLDGSSRHFTDLTGDRAIGFIREAPADQPFCLSVSFHAAHAEDGDKQQHYPFPLAEADLYADVEMPRPRLDGGESYETQPEFLKDSLNRKRYFWRWDTPEKYDRNLRDYFRMLSGLDRNIGRVMAELEARGLAGQTVVIVIGDNGYYMGERGFAGKWSHYEESLRVPLIVFDPRRPEGEAGRVEQAIALNIDIAPTILELAGLTPSDSVQGRALSSIEGEGARDGFYCEHRMRTADIPRWEGFRTTQYKYARYLGIASGAELLYDLETDPDE